jgi:hypothetical protein
MKTRVSLKSVADIHSHIICQVTKTCSGVRLGEYSPLSPKKGIILDLNQVKFYQIWLS